MVVKIALLAAIAAGGYWGYQWYMNRAKPVSQKMVILGFDGADPDLLQEYWDDLPNFRRLANRGGLHTLETVNPPESPVTWTSFATGTEPGTHGIFGSIGRPWGTYWISPHSTYAAEDANFVWGLLKTSGTRYTSKRNSPTFWEILSEQKIPSILVRAPNTFPAPDKSRVTSLSGSETPDLMGNRVAYFHFSSSYEDEKSTLLGGRLVPVRQDDEWYRGEFGGFWNPVVQDKITTVRGKRLGVTLKRVERQVLLWLLERADGSRTAETDREHLYTVIGRVGEDLRTGSVSTRQKHLADLKRLRAIVDGPDGPEAIDWLAQEDHPDKDGLRKTVRDYRQQEENLLKEQRALEERPGMPPSITKPVGFRIADESSVVVDFEDNKNMIFQNEWSGWFEVTYSITPFSRIHGLTRFYLQSVNPELNVYMHTVIADPKDSVLPISHPSGYAKELAEHLGAFETKGRSAETFGLCDEKLDEEAFLQEVLDRLRLQEAITFYTLENKKTSLFLSVFDAADRVATVMGRHLDPLHPRYDPRAAAKYRNTLKQVYVQMDAIIGKALDSIDANTVLVVVSDHGVRPFRYQVNLNNWLVQKGYMTLKDETVEPATFTRLRSGRLFIEGVDWSQTEAYSLGFGHIYINREGREPEGIVPPSEYDSLCNNIRRELLRFTDERPGHAGERVVSWVGVGKEMWPDSMVEEESDAPDLVVGFSEGYRSSWNNVLGRTDSHIIQDNTEKWSAGHASAPASQVPGFLLCDHPISYENPSILDIAPTILQYFDRPVPESMSGRDLLGPAIPQEIPTLTPTLTPTVAPEELEPTDEEGAGPVPPPEPDSATGEVQATGSEIEDVSPAVANIESGTAIETPTATAVIQAATASSGAQQPTPVPGISETPTPTAFF